MDIATILRYIFYASLIFATGYACLYVGVWLYVLVYMAMGGL